MGWCKLHGDTGNLLQGCLRCLWSAERQALDRAAAQKDATAHQRELDRAITYLTRPRQHPPAPRGTWS